MAGDSNPDNTVEEPKKPEAPDWLLENIKECSKNASRVYTVYLGYLAYCALTVVSTTDRQILLNQTAHLPLVNVAVPLNLFFVAAPAVAVLVFLYFQSYLWRLKGLTSQLQSNYAAIERRRLYPWIINIAQFPERGVIGVIQKNIVGFSLWCSLPTVLSLFTISIIKKHSGPLSYYNVVVSNAGSFIVLFLWFKYCGPVRTKWSKVWKSLRLSAGAVVSFYFLALAPMMIIPEVSSGYPNAWPGSTEFDLKRLFCLDLSHEKLVEEPTHDYEQLYWGDFSGAHLEGASLISCVLRRSDLREAQLLGAVLNRANLDSVDLTRADLTNASLIHAKLRRATLNDAILEGANLYGADLKEAHLLSTKLRGAYLCSAILDSASLNIADVSSADFGLAMLRGALLMGAKLDSTDLTDANLTGADLTKASLRGAVLASSSLSNTQMTGAHLGGASFRRANLFQTTLDSADLTGADLTGAQLNGATFRGARLTGAIFDDAEVSDGDLSGAVGLTIDQLCRARKLFRVDMDSALLKQVLEKCPEKRLELSPGK
jgi:uncharacterized protein YjbI with pentapeptide repeats